MNLTDAFKSVTLATVLLISPMIRPDVSGSTESNEPAPTCVTWDRASAFSSTIDIRNDCRVFHTVSADLTFAP